MFLLMDSIILAVLIIALVGIIALMAAVLAGFGAFTFAMATKSEIIKNENLDKVQKG